MPRAFYFAIHTSPPTSFLRSGTLCLDSNYLFFRSHFDALKDRVDAISNSEDNKLTGISEIGKV